MYTVRISILRICQGTTPTAAAPHIRVCTRLILAKELLDIFYTFVYYLSAYAYIYRQEF